MSKGLLVFTEGREVFGARITKVSLDSDTLEIVYDYKQDNVGFTGVLKATSTDGAEWSGEWTDKNQKWKSTTGKVAFAGVKAQGQGLFHGTWGNDDRAEGEEMTFSVELPRSYR